MCLAWIQAGAEYVQQRREEAQIWLNQYDGVCGQLSRVKSLLPRVKIGSSKHSELLVEARVLVSKQDAFWDSYKTFVQTRVLDELGEHGLEQCQTAVRGIVEQDDMLFVDQVAATRAGLVTHMLCFIDDVHLVPDSIDGIAQVFTDITRVLTDVNRCSESSTDKSDKVSEVILNDITHIINSVVAIRSNMSHGQRSTYIDEVNQIMKRIDRARENGSDIDVSHKERLAVQKSNLLSDQKLEEQESRKEEAAEKARIHESVKAAPAITLQKLQGFSNWLSWTEQCKNILMNISQEQTKCAIIYNSLTAKEDKRFLKGEIVLSAVMN